MGLDNIGGLWTPTQIVAPNKFTEILAFRLQSFAMNESNRVEFWGQNIAEERQLTRHKTEVSSLQEAIIHNSKIPFTIKPIVIKKEDIKKSIKTNITSNRMIRKLIKGFNNPKNSDFKFKIERQECDDPKEGCLSVDPKNGYDFIYCHKWFVEENCEHLKKLFANRESINETEMKCYSYETYYHFIQYLYTDSIETKDNKTLNELLLLSDMYSEEELKIRCVSLIKRLINIENVCDFYCSAIINKSSDLEEYCFEFMTQNMKTIVKTKDYSQMDPKIAKSFLTKYFENKSKLNFEAMNGKKSQ